MADDAWVPFVARPSAAMTLAVQYKQVFVIHGGPLQLCSVLKKGWKCKYIFIFPKINSAQQGLISFSWNNIRLKSLELQMFLFMEILEPIISDFIATWVLVAIRYQRLGFQTSQSYDYNW